MIREFARNRGGEVVPGGKATGTKAREMTLWKGQRTTHTSAQLGSNVRERFLEHWEGGLLGRHAVAS